ncbi:polyhydroxyalkanoic acid system family protein [Halobacteriovorax sp. XZX-3]|uniref:polyhydroxyalkanoic acid system family protein n=1 Tax=unclassified Halobacteriovorax TaxID=2639665 RepID=UPI000CD22B9B|nr:polyhydroxyalkanoic acid system family protein [Halobacteriovorax sp. DA5]POB14513.1 hypothetical protein C0Z22_05315 [Halobacteriovorax sp. DA5]
MSLKVNYSQASSQEEAYNLGKQAVTPEYVAKFNVKADVTTDDGNFSMQAKGKGFELKLKFEESYCLVDLDLSFMLKPLKGKILETIENKIKKTV